MEASQIQSNANQQNETLEVASALEAPAELAQKYRFIRELGHGAQGTVFEAVRISDEKHVAIKQLEINSVQNWKEYELFRREANMLATLDMPGVAKFYEAPEFLNSENPCAFIVQEFIPGQTLQAILASGYHFSINRVFEMACKLIDILEHLHQHEPPVIHRDIKPSNIMLAPKEGDDFDVFLIDFGAVANPQVQSGGSTVAGTYGYMPPEQLMGHPNAASDIYALAATLAYILSGVDPGEMQVDSFRLIIDPHLQNIPNPVVACLREMLDPIVDNRLCDYLELKKRFNAFAQNQFDSNRAKAKAKDIDARLLNIKALGMPGNIDLWMDFSDEIPRDVPNCLMNTLGSKNRANLSVYSRIALKTISASFASYRTILSIIAIFAMGAIFGFVIADVAFKGVIIGGLIALAILCALSFIPLYKGLSRFKFRSPDMNQMYRENDVRQILSRGSRTIATVVDIQYEHANLNHFEKFDAFEAMYPSMVGAQESIEYQKKIVRKNNLPPRIQAFYYHDTPKFKITYRFNPPDDDNPDDLFHSIVIRHDPAKTLHVGDPLPILYLLGEKNYATGTKKVMSMPFPFPPEDIVEFRDIYSADDFYNNNL